MVIYNLTGKEDIWWQDINKVEGIKERYVMWKTFNFFLKENSYQNNTLKKRPKNFMN